MPNRFLLCVCIAWLFPVTAQAATDLFQVLKAADSLAAAGYADSAVGLGRSVVSDYEATERAADTALGWAEHRLGNYHFASGQLDSARTHWHQAAEWYAKYGASSFKRIGIQNNFAVLESMSGRTVQAAFAFEEAVRLHREAGTDTTVDGANVMNNLALMYDELGRSDEALAYFEESGQIWKRHFGELDWHVGLNVGNRGIVYARRGQDGMAEYCFRESIRIIRSSLGPDHVRIAEPEGNLAAILVARGRYDEAEILYRDALRIIALGEGEAHPDLINRLNGLGTLYRERGQLQEAERTLRRALTIAESHGGDTSLATADQLHHLAVCLSQQDQDATADSLWDRAERIYTSQGRATSYEMLVVAQERMKASQSSTSGQAFRSRVIALSDSLYRGAWHPALASAHMALAKWALANSQWTEAASRAETALTIYLEILATNARYLNERDALAAAAKLRACRDLGLWAVVDSGDGHSEVFVPPRLAAKWSACRGLIFELLSARLRVGRTGDKVQSRMQAEYDAVRVALAREYAAPDSWKLSGDRRHADSLRQLADSLESQLALLQGDRSPRPATALPVQEFLKRHPGTFVVEYFRVSPREKPPDTLGRYVGLVATTSSDPRLVDLGSANDVDVWVAAYREHFLETASRPGVAGPEDVVKHAHVGGALRARIWDPLMRSWNTVLNTADGGPPMCVAIADGPLGLVSLGTLPAYIAEGYLADRFNFRYLSSLRDDAGPEAHHARGKGLLALGDPAFDTLVAPSDELSPDLVMRSALTDCFSQDRTMSRLPLSRWEVEQVAADWNRTHADSAMVVVGGQASEVTFRAAVSGKRALHIATHGYYLDPTCGAQEPASHTQAHPLLLSGLLMSGSNLKAAAIPAERDGILSAYEVSALDLSSAESVVLSACESGIGKDVESEGLYGLRHAFRLAGARTVVCSLWPVSDRTTAAFMSRLYNAGAESVSKQLDLVQREERDRLRREGRADHPLSWGAFISFGSVD